MPKIQIKRIIRVGNSYAVSIDPRMMLALKLLPRDYVAMRISEQMLQIRKLVEPRK